MKLPKLLRLPKIHRRTRSKARNETGLIEDQSEADLVVPRPTEPTPDLRIGTSTLPTPSPLTPHDQESNNPGTVSNRVLPVPGAQSSLTKSPDHTADPAPERKSDWKSTAYATTKLAINLVKESSDAFPPLKSVAGGISAILDHCDQTIACRQTIEFLMPRVEGLAKSLGAPVPEGEVEEEERRRVLERKLDNILQDLAPLEQRGKVTRFLNSADVNKLGGLVEDIRDAIMDYQTSLQQDIYDKSCQLIESAALVRLDRMSHVADAEYLCGDKQGCMKGTRRDVLSQLECWLNDEQDKPVFWLNGLAGTGKSTIAQTFAETSFVDGKLGASFFCSRDFDDKSNLRTIFPTLAFQLAHRYPRFREKLLPVLTTSPDVGRESLCSQMEKLIVGPLKTTHISTLIIIDALDECKDEEPASVILSILSRYVDQVPYTKFFITGRPEPRIRSGFRLAALRPITEVFKLHDVKRPLVDIDFKLFFRTRLADIARNWNHCDVTEDWPRPSDIDILCEKAAGSFIYASTVVKFVASPRHQPPRMLPTLISLPQNTVHKGEYGTDTLYTEIQRHAYRDMGSDNQKPNNQEVYRRFRSAVGAVLLAFNPLSTKNLSDLHDFDTPFDISIALNSLHSLLLVPESIEDSLSFLHKSLPDFLMDPKRCQDTQFFVDPPVHHTEILLSCLHLMEKRLKRNICNLDDYADLSNVNDLSARRKEYIGEALEYVHQFWTKHLANSPTNSPDAEKAHKAIDKFFTTQLLFWIEVLVIMRNLNFSVHSTNNIQQWYISGDFVCKWTNDSWCFILEHFDIICNSPSQIYHSALPLSPSSSWLQKFYSIEPLHEVKVVKGTNAGWGTCFHTVSLGGSTLAFSNWNSTIAVGLSSGGIIILNATTGCQMAILSGHKDQVKCLTFSSDGRSLVSGSYDMAIKLWDMQTGGVVKTFCGHPGYVQFVPILAECTRIASGSLGSMTLWDVQTEKCLYTMKQQDTVFHVSFSPINPQHIISISGGRVWHWDVNSHQVSPIYDGTHIAFSPDYIQFALCNGKVVTVQYSDSRVIVACLVFSSPSSLISASQDKSVKFWQIGTFSTDLVAVDQWSTSTPFTSPQILSVSLQIRAGITVSSDADGVVKTWDISTDLCEASFQTPATKDITLGHRDVKQIDGRLIFVWYEDKKIHIWDTGKEFL